ncbi:MAG: DUF4384 domain-containing protein [Pseudomonadota bacterium]
MRPNALACLLMLAFSPAFAKQSSITEADGESCMGIDKSRKQTEELALTDAKRFAAEFASSHITSTTVIENYVATEDIVKAFNQAEVKLLEILDEKWSPNGPRDECYSVRIKAEVIPANMDMPKQEGSPAPINDPRLPLDVSLWVDSMDATYQAGDQLKIYLQGNKPFYARLIYVDAKGNSIQLLPNQHRRDNYFQGGTLFEVPTAQDRFDLTVGEPFGKETLYLYASTMPLGQVEAEPAGPDVFLVQDKVESIGAKTRGISLTPKDTPDAGPRGTASTQSRKPGVAEFAESKVEVTTRPAS